MFQKVFGVIQNPTQQLYEGAKVPGPRINPKYLSDSYLDSADNVLKIESDKSTKIYNQILQLQKDGFIKVGHEIGNINIINLY